ncbi:MAG: molybdopterin-guanine dinucleotide biosynthesis protein B [Thermoplasmata archaeon]
MILGIYGFQDAGKTKLVEELVQRLVKKGYRVSSIKHTPHKKSIDCEGKDTWRHWKAGSDPVVFSSESETTYIKHSRTSADDIARLVMREFGPDVVIVEGFKEGTFPKVAVGNLRPRKGTVMANPKIDDLVAYVENEVAVEKTLGLLPGLDCAKCGLDCDGLARAIVARKRKLGDCKELSSTDVGIVVGGRKIAAGKFVSSIVDDTVRGMLSSLKGYEAGKEVEIRLRAKREKSKRPR